jgi:hypothetical protein
MTKGTIILFFLILLTGGGAFLFVNRDALIDRSLTEPYVEKDLKAEEIRTKLLSGDLLQKIAARKQIDKLEPEKKLRVMLVLADKSDAIVRLLAAKELRKIDDPKAVAKLAWLAENDPDETVREVAGAGR